MLIGTVLVAIYAITVAVQVTGWALDETVVKQSAVHYRHGLPGTLFHDLNARATSRLFSLLLMPIFGLWDGDTAVRIARGVASLYFVSAAIPVYLLARRVLRNPWFATAAAVLAITGPWLTLATTIYTENLAYPLFAWALLAFVWAIERGGWRADLVALLAIGLCSVTRVQLFALFPAWLVSVWVVSWGRSPGARPFARRSWQTAPISHVILGLVVLFALFRSATGHLHADAQRLLGTYSELQDRGHFSQDLFLAVAHEVQAIALPAFLAAVAALAWFGGTLRSPRTTRRWSFAVVAVVTIVVLWLISAYVQGGWLGNLTEERYFFYAFPLVWIGAFAALEEPALARPRLFAVAVPLVVLFAVLGQPRALDPQSTFLAPAAAVANSALTRLISSWQLTGLTTQDALAIVATALVLLGLWAWRRGAGPRAAVFIVLAAVLQIGFTAYAFAARQGKIPGVQSQTGGIVSLNGWIDRHAGGNNVTWLNNQPVGVAPDAQGWQYASVFWNQRIQDWAQDIEGDELGPVPTLAALPMRQVTFEPTMGLAHGLEHAGPFVSFIQSPFFQVAGRQIAVGPGNGLALIAPHEPVQALWRARHLEMDGAVNPGVPALLDAWVPPGSNAKRLRVKMVFQGPSNGPGQIALQLGKAQQTITLQPNQAQTVTVTQCTNGRHLAGTAKGTQKTTLPDGRNSSGRFVTVTVKPVAGGSC
jgi:hypothetical protein